MARNGCRQTGQSRAPCDAGKLQAAAPGGTNCSSPHADDVVGMLRRSPRRAGARSIDQPKAEQALRRRVDPKIKNFVVLRFSVPNEGDLGPLDSKHVAADLRFHLLALRLAQGRLVVGSLIKPGADLRQQLILEQPAQQPKGVGGLGESERRRLGAAHE
jgi:hypothetical protein